jgi:DNA-directed RNA polymerase subunit RPC12/RpoP
MIKCPNCGSTAQVKYLSAKYEEDGEQIVASRKYKCGCGKEFKTTQYYYTNDYEEEEVDDFDW